MKLKRSIILLFALMFIICSQVYAKDGFSSSNAYNITKELSSDKYNGRLTGDGGNQLARNYITNFFKSLGLKPGGDSNSFLQTFDIYVPTTVGSCYFKVYDADGKLVKEYTYGKDFKEMTYGASISGTVSGQLKTGLRTNSNIVISENINSAFENPRGYANDLELKANGINAIITSGDEYLRFRSPYKLQRQYDEGLVKIYASRSILPELRSFAEKNYSFEIKSSVKLKLIRGSNIIGIVEGKDSSLPPLILSAHYDHVGFDGDGVIYPGSLDNASGTGFLLECARFLKSRKQPDRTIIFAAFDGEEVGLIGSKYFVENTVINIKEAECINFDMVGSARDLPVSIIYSSNRSEFAEELLGIARSQNVPAKSNVNDSSDHAYFCSYGIKAVTLIQYDISKIHTPEDTMENVSEEGFKDIYKILSAYLSTREVRSTFLSIKAEDPAVKYLVPGAAILVITTIAVMYIVSTKKGNRTNL